MFRVSLILPVESICLLSSDGRMLRAGTRETENSDESPVGQQLRSVQVRLHGCPEGCGPGSAWLACAGQVPPRTGQVPPRAGR
jgi:hypothetical protein